MKGLSAFENGNEKRGQELDEIYQIYTRPSGEKKRKLRPQQITIQQHFVTNFCDFREKSILTQSQAKLRAPPVVVALSERRGELRVQVQLHAEVRRIASAVSFLGDSMGRGVIFRPRPQNSALVPPKTT